MSIQRTHSRHRAIALGAVTSALTLATFTASTMGALTAAITNDSNTLGTGTLGMEEANADGSVTCRSAEGTNNEAICSTINVYGGNLAMAPGSSTTTRISIKNVGTMPATAFTLTPGTCTQSENGAPAGTATDLCAKVTVKIDSGETNVFTGTAAELAGRGAITLAAPVAPNATVPFTFTTSIDSSATNTYMGLKVNQPLTWTFSA